MFYMYVEIYLFVKNIKPKPKFEKTVDNSIYIYHLL